MFFSQSSFQTEENANNLCKFGFQKGQGVAHAYLLSTHSEPDTLRLLQAFFVLILINPIRFGGITPMFHIQKLKPKEVKDITIIL